MSDQQFDVVVIGSGPGGYVHAIRCAQLGLRTACVEKRATLGGTCLNVGCIPSKALLQSSEKFVEAAHLAEHGIGVGAPTLDLATMMKRKDGVVSKFTRGVEGLFRKNKVTWVKGSGRITAGDTVEVTGADGAVSTLKTRFITIATGSEPSSLPFLEIDEKTIVSSTGALALEKVPGRLAVIGGGVIGLELGTVWHRLGSKVTVVEFLDNILAGMDVGTAKDMAKIVKKQGMEVLTGTKVTGAAKTAGGVSLTWEPVAGGEAQTQEFDVVLVSVGRRAYIDGLGLDKLGVAVERGKVVIDDHFKTNVDGIYALGDVVRGPMLAHKAEDEGMALAEIYAGQAGHVNYDVIPGVVYTWPEVASVGKTEEQLKEAGIAYKVGKFPFLANSRAGAVGETDGSVKILADATTDRVLGCHIIGPNAGENIHEIVAIMEFGGSAEDVARTCHAHPTLAEAIKEAALAVDARAIHI